VELQVFVAGFDLEIVSRICMHFSELFFYQEQISILAKLIIIDKNDCFSLSAVFHDKIILFQFLS
jgi:hypothetical protein